MQESARQDGPHSNLLSLRRFPHSHAHFGTVVKVQTLQTTIDLNQLDCSLTQLISKYQTGHAKISAGHTNFSGKMVQSRDFFAQPNSIVVVCSLTWSGVYAFDCVEQPELWLSALECGLVSMLLIMLNTLNCGGL